MDRLRSALTGVNVLIALASLALVLIVVSRIPRVRAFLASVMPKRPGAKPASANTKPASAAGPSTAGAGASGAVGAVGAGASKKKNRPPVSDTESDEEREAMCRTRPVTLVALARPQQAAHGPMGAHGAHQVEEIHSDEDDDDEYYDDSDAKPRKELEKEKEEEKELEKKLEKELEKGKEEKEEKEAQASVAHADAGPSVSAAPARKRGARRK